MPRASTGSIAGGSDGRAAVARGQRIDIDVRRDGLPPDDVGRSVLQPGGGREVIAGRRLRASRVETRVLAGRRPLDDDVSGVQLRPDVAAGPRRVECLGDVADQRDGARRIERPRPREIGERVGLVYGLAGVRAVGRGPGPGVRRLAVVCGGLRLH